MGVRSTRTELGSTKIEARTRGWAAEGGTGEVGPLREIRPLRVRHA
jgi:hypothetical protein